MLDYRLKMIGKVNTVIADFYSVVYSRRSVRIFNEQPVETKTLNKILEAAMVAPSAHNAQPVRFFVIRTDKMRRNLISSMSELYLKDLIHDGIDEKRAFEIVERSRTILSSAPILILAGLTMCDMWNYPDEERQSHEYTMAIQSAAAAIQNLLLSAHSEGLASCWLCAPLFAKEIVVSALGLAKEIDPQAFIVLGYSSESVSMPRRRPFNEIVHML
jgi:coenzyme F420-0:L-glutamate ligase/coenzyme F420-1:gamma-L-glutamate ligase